MASKRLKRKRKINWHYVAAVAIPILAGIILAFYIYPMMFGVPRPVITQENIIRGAWIEVDEKHSVAYLVVIVYNPAPSTLNITKIEVEGKPLNGGPTPDDPYPIPPGSEKRLMYVVSTNKKYVEKLVDNPSQNITVVIDYRVENLFNYTVLDVPVLIKG